MAQVFTELRSLRSSLAVQLNVMSALLMREVLSRWGRRGLGFAWMFLEPLTFAAPVLTVWSYVRSPIEHGIPLMYLMYTGYMPLLIFRHVTGPTIRLVSSNGAVLYHSVVTPMDIFLARCGLEMFGTLGSAIVLGLALYMIGVIPVPYDYPMMLIGFVYTAWWSVAIGMVVSALSERSEMVGHIWAPTSYLYIFFSGCFFMMAWIPQGLRYWVLLLDPPWHCYEMIREGLYGNLVNTYYNIPYISIILCVLTVIGLWLMRHLRKHLDFI